MSEKQLKIRNKTLSFLLIFVLAVSAFSFVLAGGENSRFYIENIENFNSDSEGQMLGGTTSDDWNVGGNLAVTGTSAFTGTVSFSGASTLTGNTSVGGTLDVTGDTTISGELATLESSEEVSAANILTVAESNLTTYIKTTGATTTLPAVDTATSTVYRFVVGAAFSTNAVIASAEGDNIEGALIVNGAVVDCDAEDYITFVADGENLGDFVELRSDGDSWFIGASGALTASKLTCTDPS